MNNQRDLAAMLRAPTPLIVVQTDDEQHFLHTLVQVMFEHSLVNVPTYSWSITEGLVATAIKNDSEAIEADPFEVLHVIAHSRAKSRYVLLDFHPFLEDPKNVRMLKDIVNRHADLGHTIILVSHNLTLPDELKAYSTEFVLNPPTRDEREKIINDVADAWLKSTNTSVRADRDALEKVIDHFVGLSVQDTKRLARHAIFDDGVICNNDVSAVLKTKFDLLDRQGALTYEYDHVNADHIGGMEHLKTWLTQRQPVFANAPGTEGFDKPKGLMLIGVQGCGKSAAAKMVASVFKVPLLRLDFSGLYNKYIGESERFLRESLKACEHMAPCVLWIDEIEKGIASGQDESGTSQRMLGAFLTWLSEQQDGVFVMATANDISRLPPELIRKGRFDELFFVDLPTSAARAAIFRIHLMQRDLKPEDFDTTELVKHSEGFSGAEIEQAIVASLYTTFASGGPLTTEPIVQELKRTKPLSVVMQEKVSALRAWAAERTVPASA